MLWYNKVTAAKHLSENTYHVFPNQKPARTYESWLAEEPYAGLLYVFLPKYGLTEDVYASFLYV